MLAIFDAQLTSIDSELLTLQSRLAELKKIKKDLEAKQSKASEALDSLKALTSDLAGEAIDNLKAAVLAIFPSAISENSNSAPQTELFTNFVTEVPKMPTVEEIFDAECLPQQQSETIPPGSLVTIGTSDGGSISWVVPEQKPFAELVTLNSTVAYQRKRDGEIICAYLGTSSQKLAKDWAELLILRGHDTEVRKAKRLSGEDIKWEVKIKRISLEALQRLNEQHSSPFEPAINPEKKPDSPSAEPTPNSAPTNSDADGTDSIAESSSAASNDNGETATEASNSASFDPADTDDFYFVRPSQFDALCPDWDVYLKPDNKYVGRVRRHLKKDAYQHSLLRGAEWQQSYWPSAEEAAIALLRCKEAQQTLHDLSNAQMRAAAGF